MGKLAGVATVGLWLAFAGCGGDDDDDDDDIVPPPDAAAIIDAAEVPDAAPPDAPDYCAPIASSTTARTLTAAIGEPPPLRLPAGPAVCDPVAQTGCAAAEKCAAILDDPATNASHLGCIADGTQGIGESCLDPVVAGASDDCAAGGECYNGLCHELCTSTPDTCSSGLCIQFVDGTGSPQPTQICGFACNPLAQDCVAETEVCVFFRGAGVCLVPAGGTGAPEGSTCMYANGCAEGLICIGPSGSAVCRAMCGAVKESWTVVDGEATTPFCCGPNCPICLQCARPNEICAFLGDGAGGTASDSVGACFTDTDLTSDTVVCDCSNAPTVCEAIGGVSPAPPVRPVEVAR